MTFCVEAENYKSVRVPSKKIRCNTFARLIVYLRSWLYDECHDPSALLENTLAGLSLPLGCTTTKAQAHEERGCEEVRVDPANSCVPGAGIGFL